MEYYTKRNGLRKPIEKTYIIDFEAYELIFEVCQKYFDNIAWNFPDECPDGYGCCGLNLKKLNNLLHFEIPDLFKDKTGNISIPQRNTFYGSSEEYDQYALLDFVEFIYKNCRDISSRKSHSFFNHEHLSFSNTNESAKQFLKEINRTFEITGLLYRLTENGTVERMVNNLCVIEEINDLLPDIAEIGLKQLLEKAIVLYKSPKVSSHSDAVEKIWDAFERLKTYYPHLDKARSADKIIKDIARDNKEFEVLLNEEFLKLTRIGNCYRIRHHETDKVNIEDDRHFDYFFNRCLSLVSLAVQYLEK